MIFHIFQVVISILKKLRILRKFQIFLISNTLTQLQKNSKIDLATLEKIKRVISVFTQPLTISVENVSRADLQLELCDLQSDPFY